MTIPMTDFVGSRDPLRMTYEQGWRKVWETIDPGTWVCGNYITSGSDVPTLSILFRMKQGLTNSLIGRWTVLASSGKAGTGSLVASAGDNWLSSSDLVRAANGTSPRAWILLRSPATYRGTFYLLMDWWGSLRPHVQFYFTKSCPDYSSPVTDARPPATGNEWTHLNSQLLPDAVRYGGIRTYLIKAHDGSFVFACALGGTTGAWHRFQAGTLFNILQAGSSPSWDTTQAVSTRWSGTISQQDQISFKTLHRDGSDCTLEQVQFQDYITISENVLLGAHTDDVRRNYICYPPQLVSIDSGKKCWRGILEDLALPPNQIAEGAPFFRNGAMKGIRIGSWVVPVTRNLVLV